MGFIRSTLFVLASFLLLISLLLMNSFWMLSLSLDYEHIQENVAPAISAFVMEQMNFSDFIGGKEEFIAEYCKKNPEFHLEEEDFSITLPCEELASYVNSDNWTSEEILSGFVEGLINKTYHTRYECEFLDCLKEGKPLFIFSSQAHDFLESKFGLFVLVSIVLFIVMLLFAETKSGGFIVAGSLGVLSALPFLKFRSLFKLVGDPSLVNIFDALFSPSVKVFWVMFALGIALILFGVFLKVFKVFG